MPLNVVIPSNLDTDFTIDVAKSKIYNNSIIIGTGVPVANPPVEEKVWLYARNDNGGIAGDYAITHIWEPATLVWEPLGAAVDFRLSAISVDANTGEVTFTITDPVSGASSTITTDLTNLVDVQETVTILTEVAPGQLNYTDEDAVVNVVDISGLRDTGQTAQRVEVIGDTFNLIPNGTDIRVVVNDASSTATFVDGTTTVIHYTGDNVLGSGENGDAGILQTSSYLGANYVRTSGTGINSGLLAADNDFSALASVNISRNSTTDESSASTNTQSDAGYSNFTRHQSDSTLSAIQTQTFSPIGNSTSHQTSASATAAAIQIQVNDTNGNSIVDTTQANATTALLEASATSNQGFVSSYGFVADQVEANFRLSTTDNTNDFNSTINSVSNLTSSDLSLSSTVGTGATKTYLTLNTDGTDHYTRIGSADAAATYSYLENTSNATDQSATLTTAQSATTYSLIDLDTSATNSTVSISSFMGADNRNITVAPASIEIGAGDVAANAVGGANGDVLVRFGTGSEVRFAPLATAIGAELNVNTGTPALELEIGGSVVDTVPLVDVLDAFNVHQFYAIP